LIVMLGLILYSVPPVYAQNGPPPAPVAVAAVQETELAPLVWVSGSVISRNDARVAAETEGRLEWLAEVGDAIKKGQAVARIDDTRLKLEQEQLEAQLNRVDARLTFLRQEVARLQRLALQNNAAKNQLDETIADRDSTQAEMAAIRVQLRQVKVDLDRTAVKAPFTGVVSERLLAPGEWVDSGDAVARLVDTDSLEVQANVPIEAADYVTAGSTLLIKSGNDTVTGTIRALVPVGDPRSRLLDVRLTLGQSRWLVGRTVRVAVPTAMPRKVLAVPRDALVLRRAGTAVYRIGDDQSAQRIEVTTGIASGNLIEVQGDLSRGDQVVVRGGERLRPGQKVSILNP
jgi:RND family efflux transporter MFP subunit